MSVESKEKKFKLKTQIWILIGFQFLMGIAIVIVSYILAQLKLIPNDGSSTGTGTIGAFVGGYCYGLWIEKKYPQIIGPYLKKLTAWATLTSILICLPFMLAIVLFSKLTIQTAILLLIVALLIAALLGYVITYWGIKFGIFQRRRRIAKA